VTTTISGKSLIFRMAKNFLLFKTNINVTKATTPFPVIKRDIEGSLGTVCR
jgi:hypothetical protein